MFTTACSPKQHAWNPWRHKCCMRGLSMASFAIISQWCRDKYHSSLQQLSPHTQCLFPLHQWFGLSVFTLYWPFCAVCLYDCINRGPAETVLCRLLSSTALHPHTVCQPLPGPLHHLHHRHQCGHYVYWAFQAASGESTNTLNLDMFDLVIYSCIKLHFIIWNLKFTVLKFFQINDTWAKFTKHS